jgi:hypothetical protein
MVDESVKFAWAYLLTYGKLTNGSWCTYSGWEDLDRTKWIGYEERIQMLEEVRKETLKHGVDWEQTTVPRVTNESVFNDTESPNSDVLATLGTLVLKNGQTFLIGSQDDDAAHLAETARQIINKQHSPVQELADLL